MWIASANGFVLIETAEEGKGNIMIKAFCKEDFVGMVDQKRISAGKDPCGYFFAKIAKQELADILVKLVKSVDYENFEDAISSHPIQVRKKDVYVRFLKDVGALY
ncbi:hypothetical protein [Litoribacter populi]|uniref:hypothetical protein n=1 Tax=Litoribacter populi TaxID=2598460 RepID=UPI00118008AE|nr:hypothetical protein [Litoribacter populi]